MSVPLPSDSALNQVHPVDASLPPLGHNHGVPISTAAPTRVIVKEKMFSWTGDSYKIKHDDGRAFGSNLYFKAKLFSVRDQIVLMNGLTGKPVCVAKSMFRIGFGEEFRIYTTTPVYDGQRKSEQKYENCDLYTYAIVERSGFSTQQIVRLPKNGDAIAYTINRAGNFWPKNRTVEKNGATCALMSGGTWEFDGNSYKITVNPGIDTCLMVMLCAICDEMDENQK